MIVEKILIVVLIMNPGCLSAIKALFLVGRQIVGKKERNQHLFKALFFMLSLVVLKELGINYVDPSKGYLIKTNPE